MANYSMWLLEYAHIPTQAMSVFMAGQHNQGIRLMPFSYLVLKGEGPRRHDRRWHAPGPG